MAQTSLPIWQIHASIIAELEARNRLVLVAPTGSGKTTQVPQMLLDGGLATGSETTRNGKHQTAPKKIVVLQPRRVAARTVAARVAWERRCSLGAEVGYQIRFDDQTSLGTRICYVTEGILLRWLQGDPRLNDVGIVLFDEFHERSLLSDVALGLTKQLQESSRPDLKLAVMSATMEAEPVAEYLGGCSVLVSEGQSFPVEVKYLAYRDQRPASEQAADMVEQIVRSDQSGDILIFMPGVGEINATINACRSIETREKLAFIPLHGELQPEEQDVAFAPNPLRKVVVATNVAETSVTIDGIRHVIDSGLARVARYDAERGFGTLFVEEISRASAEQRKGRAGRTAPGTCHRLWTESGQLNRPERNTPEIQRSDLAEVVLLLHSLGIRKAAAFDWLDKPDAMAVERAEKLLRMLGALERSPEQTNESIGADAPSAPKSDHTSDLTRVGRQMLRLPMHPRYSRMLVEATGRGCVPLAALCTALVSGRDLLHRVGRDDKSIAEARELFEASQHSDFFTLIRAYQYAKKNEFRTEACRRFGINAQAARQVEQTYGQILSMAQRGRSSESGSADPTETQSEGSGPPDDDALLKCIMAGLIDQLCKRRDQGTLECDLTEGRHGTLMRESVVQNSPLFVAAVIREVTSRGSENLTLLGLASAVKKEWISELFPQHLSVRIEHLYDRTHKRVAAVKLTRFVDLVIDHEHQRDLDPAASGRCLAEAHLKGWFELPLFNHELKQLIARVNLICATLPELDLPVFDSSAINACLAHAFEGLSLTKEAQGTHLRESFLERLAPEQRSWIDELAPLTVEWPDGRRLKLVYPESSGNAQPAPPELQVKLHECFALKEHPRICEGRVPVKLWLSAPDGKRIESTTDWAAFKTQQYPKLKAALAKKYPGVLWV